MKNLRGFQNDTLSLSHNGVPTRCGSEAVINHSGAIKVKVSAGIYGKGWIYAEQGNSLTGQQNLRIGDYNLRVEAVTGFVHVL